MIHSLVNYFFQEFCSRHVHPVFKNFQHSCATNPAPDQSLGTTATCYLRCLFHPRWSSFLPPSRDQRKKDTRNHGRRREHRMVRSFTSQAG